MAGSTLLPRIGTPSLSNQVHQWKQPAPRTSQWMGVAEVRQRRRAGRQPVWTWKCMAGRLFTPQGDPFDREASLTASRPGAFRSTCPGSFGVRRPHLESRERPQTSAPQVEPKTALQAPSESSRLLRSGSHKHVQAGRTTQIIENNFRT